MRPNVHRSRFWVWRVLSGLVALVLGAGLAGLPPFLPASNLAYAESDAFGLGNGHTGALAVSTANTVINSYAQITAPLAPGDTSISVSTSAGFAAGDLVMILQTTGVVPVPSSGTAVPFDLSGDPVGRWELARLASAGGTALGLAAPAIKSYAASVSQIIRIPEYTTVTISAGASITAASWNGATGGVLAFLATGAIANNGTIRTTGLGFRGGSYLDDSSAAQACTGLDEAAPSGAQKGEGIANTRYGASYTGPGNIANGGGGGVCLKSGGGGGGNGGAGGGGGNSDGTFDGGRSVGGNGGGALTYSLLDHLTLGGGGGAGHGSDGSGVSGGRGGGAIFIRGAQLTGAGTVMTSGTTGGIANTDGGSGGGAGGSIYLRITGSVSCGGIAATGGIGGSINSAQIGPGGGGAGGRVLFQAASGGCTVNVLGALAGTQQDAAAPGGTAYGALAGATGVVETLAGGFTQPAAPTVSTPGSGARTNSQRPIISGTAAANQTIIISLDGAELARTTSNSLGNWSFTPSVDISAGTHQIQAIAEYQAVQSTPSASLSFTVDITAPAAPSLSLPAEGALLANSRPAIAGTAEPSSTLALYLDGSAIGTTVVSAAGDWAFTPPSALPDGSHALKLTATDAAGNVSDFSTLTTFTVDTIAPGAPSLITPLDGLLTNNTHPTIAGTAEPSSTLTLYLDGSAIGTTVVSATGTWAFTPTSALSDGPHTLKFAATDRAGNTSGFSTSITVTVDTAPPSAPTSVGIANGTTIYTATPTLSGSAEPGSTATIYLDGVAIGTAGVDSQGHWEYTFSIPLAAGSHSVQASIADAAGNASPLSAPSTIVYVPAQAPTFTSAAPATAVYGTSYSHVFTFTGTPTPTITLAGGALPPGLALNGATLAGTPTLAGSYGPIALKVSNGYTADAIQIFTLVVAKATLTATPHSHSRVVGAANPNFSVHYSGFVPGDTAAGAIMGAPHCESTATPASPAGSYSIHCSIGTLAASNYAFEFAEGTLTVTSAPSSIVPRQYLPFLQN